MAIEVFPKASKKVKFYVTFSCWAGWGWMPEAHRTKYEAEMDMKSAAEELSCDGVSGPHLVEITLNKEDMGTFLDRLGQRLFNRNKNIYNKVTSRTLRAEQIRVNQEKRDGKDEEDD